MNLAFRREVIPAFYQLPMDDNEWEVGRFDDIWSGVFLNEPATYSASGSTTAARCVNTTRPPGRRSTTSTTRSPGSNSTSTSGN